MNRDGECFSTLQTVALQLEALAVIVFVHVSAFPFHGSSGSLIERPR